MMEVIMEHIAKVVDKDPLQVRVANLPKDSPIPNMIEDAKKLSDFHSRQKNIEEFNQVCRNMFLFVTGICYIFPENNCIFSTQTYIYVSTIFSA